MTDPKSYNFNNSQPFLVSSSDWMENYYSLKLIVQPQNKMLLKKFLSRTKKQRVHGGNEQRVKRFQAAEPVLAL